MGNELMAIVDPWMGWHWIRSEDFIRGIDHIDRLVFPGDMNGQANKAVSVDSRQQWQSAPTHGLI